ncbi:tRNA lysidine(34) synthetase TilS [Campylobacter sp.]|uniref:tRNA lysidine(34) synthetase TilS n=1 Tax=Campylobacter sp. TaxID=205 RepID=UPI0027032005|nr:tRNA lysidine(34) synthetase TilS [Campylobacter sp.]
MIKLAELESLRLGKNLLAFSHGVDSTALFYLLYEAGVEFDIAVVDYNLRASSKDEIASSRELAAKFAKRIFELSVKLESANFECKAREVRYEFFERICKEFCYTNLILAHQLDDKFEWFLMQFSKGAGLSELFGMKSIENRKDYTLIRPLLNVSKQELLEFLDSRGFKYFVDETNLQTNFTRNKFRVLFSEPFLAKFRPGVVRSFELLALDIKALEPEILHIFKELYLVKNDLNLIRGIDKVCKILGVVMSKAQRDECEKRLKNQTDLVISGKVAVGYGAKFIFVSPFVKAVMDKKFKEACRVAKVPKIVRPYLYAKEIEPQDLKDYL